MSTHAALENNKTERIDAFFWMRVCFRAAMGYSQAR
jgi:hypothetical protein